MSSANLLIPILIAAVYWDIRERRIPNILVAIGMPAGLLASFVAAGQPGLAGAAGGLLAGIAVFFPFFAMRIIGAGDVKLFGVVGAFVGFDDLFSVIFFTLLAGGTLGVVSVVASGATRKFFDNLKMLAITTTFWLRGSKIAPVLAAGESAARVPYAVAIAAGVVIWMWRS